MVERNSLRGRKPIIREKTLTIITTSKRAKLIIGKDIMTITRGQNLLISRP
jgi:hypothetical protein